MLFVLLQSAPSNSFFGQFGPLLVIVLMFVVMYFFIIRPQKKQKQALEQFQASLKRGDKVVTIGGIYGTVEEVKEDSLLIKVDGDVKLRVDKSAIVKSNQDLVK